MTEQPSRAAVEAASKSLDLTPNLARAAQFDPALGLTEREIEALLLHSGPDDQWPSSGAADIYIATQAARAKLRRSLEARKP